jgi:hypothetical protein
VTLARIKCAYPSGIEWLYAEPPSVSSVIGGISTVTVKLIGEMHMTEIRLAQYFYLVTESGTQHRYQNFFVSAKSDLA